MALIRAGPLVCWAAVCLVLVLFVLLGTESAAAHSVLCRRCGATIATVSKLLSEEETPPSSSSGVELAHDEDHGQCVSALKRFKNRVGQSFDLALFERAAVRTTPSKSVQDTFFPGYAWRIAECPVCRSFLGWHFERPAVCHDHQKPVKADAGTEKKTAIDSKAKDDYSETRKVEGGDIEKKPESGPEVRDVNKVLNEALKDKCLTKALGYWNIEWCHQTHVMQFHVTGPSVRREPQYSLGNFASQETILVERPRIEQTFTGGQRCDETNAPRSSVVLLVCCGQPQKGLTSGQAAFIAAYREPSMCSYELMVCVPELCAFDEFVLKSSADPLTGHAQTTSRAGTSASQLADNIVCATGTPPATAARSFYGLDWSALVCEAGSELQWTKSLKPIVGTGQFA